MEEIKHKLGIIVPYRDRFRQLTKFLDYVPLYLRRQNIEYKIIVAEQADKEGFNRGALLNVGFLEAKKAGCDYVAFHDVDLLPRYVDYSYADVPLELVGKIVDPSYEEGFQIRTTDLTDDYFGGVTLFPVEVFEKINGYSNKYIGWGFEDNDLLYRCREAQIPLGYKNYKQYETVEPALTFDGIHSYVRVPFNKASVHKGVSFLATFRVEDLKYNRKEASDECAIFCIPGLDAALCYESFGTYKFEIFDNYEDVYSIHTKKYPLGITIQAIVSLDYVERVGKLYINGKEVGKFEWPEGRTLKFGSNEIYLGVGHPTRVHVSRKWFRGQISDFAVFSRALTRQEVWDAFSKGYLGLGQFNPKQWYSGKVTKLDGLELPNLGESSIVSLDGEMREIKISPLVSPECFYRLTIPLQRPGVFISQPHKTNGTELGYWKSWATRLNQFRYEDVETFGSFKSKDGLSSIGEIVSIKRQENKAGDIIKLQVSFKEKK